MRKFDKETIAAIAEAEKAIAAAKDALQGEADAIEEFVGSKSDKWREGEKGQAYDEWRGQIEEAINRLDDAESEIAGLATELPQ